MGASALTGNAIVGNPPFTCSCDSGGADSSLTSQPQPASEVDLVVVTRGVLVDNPFRGDFVLLAHLLGETLAKGVKGGAHSRLAHKR